MKFLILVLCLFTQVAWAQLQTEKIVSEELNVTTANAARPFLLFSATNAALAQYSTELGINYPEFQKKLNEKFEKYFTVYKERKLAEKFGKQYSEQLTEEQKQEFLKSVEENRPQEFLKYSRILETLDSYTIKQIEADANNPKLWKATIDLKLNKTRIDNLVARVSSNTPKQYSKIFVIAEVNPINLSWSELNLEKESTFSEPVLSAWGKWYNKHLPTNVEEIELCHEECLRTFTTWQNEPQDEGMLIPAEALNSLWLRVSLNLKKVSYKQTMNEWSFEWNGSAVLLDANTKRALMTANLGTASKTWRGLEQKDLNSALASAIYRSPLSIFKNFNKKIQDLPQLNRLSRLVIRGHKNLGDVLSLMKLLEQEGKRIGLDLKLDLFTQNEAQLLCFYQGEEKSFTDLLSRPKELKSSHSYSLVNEYTGVHHVMNLVAE